MTTVKTGVLFNTDRMKGPEFTEYAQRLEKAGVESVWLAELFGREPFAAAGSLLANTTTLRVGTAIANIYVRDAVAAAAGAATLAELSGERFELGLGVSNRGLNESRGHEWTAPVPRLTDYLQTIKSTKLALPETKYPVHVAAHGPKMLEAASANADGVFTYLMNSQHTARTRDGVDADTIVTPMMMCLLCEDPDQARTLVRKAIGYYTGLDYYHRAWRTLGFDDNDFSDGGSDRLVDAIVAWGSIDDIRNRLGEQGEAGATRVVVIPLNAAGGGQPDWNLLEQLNN
jgi:probable F420-dependent oxidoreductase